MQFSHVINTVFLNKPHLDKIHLVFTYLSRRMEVFVSHISTLKVHLPIDSFCCVHDEAPSEFNKPAVGQGNLYYP